MKLCDYGCGCEAKFYSKWYKTWRCSKYTSTCPEIRKKISRPSPIKGQRGIGSFLGKKHTQKSIQKISDAMKGNTHATHRGDRQSFYKGIRMDSRWEIGTAEYLDDNNIFWKYSEKGYRLSDGRYYYPDFFIYEDHKFVKLIEVKGYFRKNNRLKFEQFLKEYPHIKIELWDKKKLLELKIINSSGYLRVNAGVGEPEQTVNLPSRTE